MAAISSLTDRHHERTPEEDAQRRQRRLLLIAFVTVLAVVGLVLLAERAAGDKSVLDHLRDAEPAWLGLAIVAEGIALAGFVAAVRGVFAMRGGAVVSYRTAGRLMLASLGASRAILGGGPAAIAVVLWGARKTGLPRNQAASRVLALYVLQFGVLAIGTWLCALAVVLTGRGLALAHLTLPWLVAVPLVVLAAASFRAPALHAWIPGPIGRWLERALAEIEDGFGYVREIATHPRAAAVLIAAALLDWLGDATCLWASLSAFGLLVRPDRFLLAYSTAYLVTLLPLPFAGLGTVEAATVLSLRAIGVPVSAGFLAVLAYRAINFWLPTVPGLMSLATLSSLGRRLAQARDRGSP